MVREGRSKIVGRERGMSEGERGRSNKMGIKGEELGGERERVERE